MKYNLLFGLAALALGFTACDDIEESDSLPQSNPQLEMVKASSVEVTKSDAAGAVINLWDANAADTPVSIATVAATEEWPEGFSPVVTSMQVSTTEGFDSYASVEAITTEEGVVTVESYLWDEVIKNAVGRNPADVTCYLRFPVLAVSEDGKQSVRMGGENTYYGNFAVKVTPFNLFDHVIEDHYYLITSANNFDIARAIPLVHNGQADVYDDPVFTVSIPVENAGLQWAVIPESTKAAGKFGEAYGVDPATGNLVLVPAGQPIPYGEINETGHFDFTFNMETLAADVKGGATTLWTPGDSNGWNQDASQTLLTTDYVHYTGYAHLSGGFKFTTQADWSGTNYGQGDSGVLSTDPLAPNLDAPANALYWVDVNLPALTYALTQITTIGMIGDATPKGWDGDTALTPSADFLTWSATVALGAGEFKFRANGDWDINLGGDLTDLAAGGSNIPSPGEGTYVVTLDLSARPYTATLTRQ